MPVYRENTPIIFIIGGGSREKACLVSAVMTVDQKQWWLKWHASFPSLHFPERKLCVAGISHKKV
ncbi:hypothetical protein MTBBW1_630013 [Desulfamplus magnetovallimortis]|uniref:Uncharacterized protein n=1 Tax=Desulfamplus magnetovallimortis TaxID=1246637 RepID=A0A1W1HIL4_9BACT|nr:hypothetical protein MTBBW1_630013 [Desulfamplus magnetovallimortis]